MPKPAPPSYTTAEAWCIDAAPGDYGSSDITWDQTLKSLCSYGPLYEQPVAGTTPYNNLDILPRKEINGGQGYNYVEVIAACDRTVDHSVDYGYSDMLWSTINRSICTWPPEDEDYREGADWYGEVPTFDYHSSSLSPLSGIDGRYIEYDGSSALAPWSNSVLRFKVETDQGHVDPETGNYTPILETLTYAAYLQIQPPNYQEKQGVDVTAYTVNGRLLNPSVLDKRIQNGAQAEAEVNGFKGRFEFRFPLQPQSFSYPVLRQQITGIFHVMGGRN